MVMMKRVWSRTSDSWIRCNWFECGKDGYENHKAVMHDHHKLIPCDSPMATHINYIFCSESHLQYYMNSHKDLWNLPTGLKKP